MLSERNRRLWKNVRAGLIALSLANLCLISCWFPILYGSDHGYFNKLPVTGPMLLALFANFVWVTALAWVLIGVERRSRKRWLRGFLHLVLMGLLLLPLDFIRLRMHVTDYQLFTLLTRPTMIVPMICIAALAIWKHRRGAQVAATVTGVMAPLAFFTLTRLLLVSLGTARVEQATHEPALPAIVAAKPEQPRLVWILFDEMDQRALFEQRPPGFQFPEFDRLSQESIFATNAYPPASTTLYSIPALTSGQRFSAAVPVSSSDLRLTLADSGTNALWSELPSIFDSARELGINTALVGWYHPYARIFSRSLNYCRWYPFPWVELGRAPTFGRSMLYQLGCTMAAWPARVRFVEICRDGIAQAIALSTNSTYGLTTFHLAPPHSPGVYLPDRDAFTIFGMSKVNGYFNNMVLADRALGKIRAAIKASGLGDKTWLMVSTDHFWRQSTLYDGRICMRIPFFLQAPMSKQGIRFSSRINTVLSHDLALAILRSQVTNQISAVEWLEAHRTEDPPLPTNRGSD